MIQVGKFNVHESLRTNFASSASGITMRIPCSFHLHAENFWKKRLDDRESCCILNRASVSRRVKRFTGNRLQPRRLSKQSSTNMPKHSPKMVNSLFSLFLPFLIVIVLLSLCLRGCLRPTRTHQVFSSDDSRLY